MTMTTIRNAAAALAAGLGFASCAPRPAPPALPPPAPPPIQAPPPAPAPAPPSDWQDRPLSGGDWLYGDQPRPRAAFVQESALFAIECADTRQIRLARTVHGAASSTLTIRTTYGERSLRVSEPSVPTAELAPSDPLLDEMAFSRGRFLVRVEGLPDLILPAWPEVARVIEECRG
jgi:hypothetical protein